MAFPTPPDFRTTTLAEYCNGLALTDAEAPDAKLTAAIARMAARVEAMCDDQFTSGSATYELVGDGTSVLPLPARCTAVSTVKTRDYLGTLTTQAATVYRLVSSLDASGAERLTLEGGDYLEVVAGQYLTGVSYRPSVWPQGVNTVQVAGTFGWVTTPTDVNRAVALLTWDHFKALDPYRRSARQWNTTDTDYLPQEGPTSLREVNDIIVRYRRPESVLVA